MRKAPAKTSDMPAIVAETGSHAMRFSSSWFAAMNKQSNTSTPTAEVNDMTALTAIPDRVR